MGDSAFFTGRAIGVQGSPPRAGNSSRQLRHLELKQKLATLQRDYADLHTALFEAGQVHRRLCAPRLVRYGPFDIASEIFAVRYLPGDFFAIEEDAEDVEHAEDAGVILALGDVCGKGLAAGMWTPCLVGLIRAHAAASREPHLIVAEVNREFCRMGAPLTSLFIARLDPDDGTLDYCSAGHPPALLLRGAGQLESLSAGGMLLGMAAGASFATGRVRLGAADVLVAYTDGVIESRNDADEEFGSTRLEAQLRSAGDAPAEDVLFSVLAAVQDFAAPHALTDDTSLVVVRSRSGFWPAVVE